MIGKFEEFTCKKCGTKQTHQVEVTPLVRINDKTKTYIPLKCSECGKWHYISLEKSDEADDIVIEDEATKIEPFGTMCF